MRSTAARLPASRRAERTTLGHRTRARRQSSGASSPSTSVAWDQPDRRTLNDDRISTRRGAKFSRVSCSTCSTTALPRGDRLKGETLDGPHERDLRPRDVRGRAGAARGEASPQRRPGQNRRAHLLAAAPLQNGHRMIAARTRTAGSTTAAAPHTYGDCDESAVSPQLVDDAVLQHFTSRTSTRRRRRRR